LKEIENLNREFLSRQKT